MKRYGRSGWFKESHRHALAAKGIRTYRAEKPILVRFQGSNGPFEERLSREEFQAIEAAKIRGEFPGGYEKVVDESLPPQEEFAYRETLKTMRRRPKIVREAMLAGIEEMPLDAAGKREFIIGSRRALRDILGEDYMVPNPKDGHFAMKGRPGVQLRVRGIPVTASKLKKGNIYPVSPDDVRKVLESSDDAAIRGLKRVRFVNPKDKHQKDAWAQYIRSKREIRIFSQPEGQNGAVDGKDPQDVHRFIKQYVIPHEIGHHRALYVEKLTDRDLRMAEARADAHVVGMDPRDRDVSRLRR